MKVTMKVTKTKTKSVSDRLKELVEKLLPRMLETGLHRHLRGEVTVDPKSHGTAVIFRWGGKDLGYEKRFRLSSSVRVTQEDFMNSWEQTEEAIELEKAFRRKFSGKKVKIA